MASETASEIWAQDLLGRRKDSEFLLNFLLKRVQERSAEQKEGSYSININAPWGAGKTFFLTNFAAELRSKGYFVAEINAWREDSGIDPTTAVLASIQSVISPHLSGSRPLQNIWNKAKNSAGQLILDATKIGIHRIGEFAFGQGLEKFKDIIAPDFEISKETIESLKEDGSSASAAVSEVLTNFMKNKIDNYQRHMQSMDFFKQQLGLFVKSLDSIENKHSPFFIFVDELDRCRPTYAVNMLEDIKHIFDVSGLVFVFATNTEQLNHTITAIYGNGFDANRYLLRFFNRQYTFSTPKLEIFVSSLFSKNPGLDSKFIQIPFYSPAHFFARQACRFKLSLRDAEQAFEMLRDFVSVWSQKTPINLVYLIPLIFCWQQRQMDWFQMLASCQPLRGINGPFLEDWDMQLAHASHRHEKTSQPINIIEEHFMQAIKMDLTQIPQHFGISGDYLANYISHTFTKEHQDIYKGYVNRGTAYWSVCKLYPEVVRSLAHFADVSKSTSS